MNYLKKTLSAPTLEAILNDIKSMMWKGEAVYPDYPNDYEKSFGPGERFIVTVPKQDILEDGKYAEDGTEITPPVVGNWESILVLPLNFDTSIFKTLKE